MTRGKQFIIYYDVKFSIDLSDLKHRVKKTQRFNAMGGGGGPFASVLFTYCVVTINQNQILGLTLYEAY